MSDLGCTGAFLQLENKLCTSTINITLTILLYCYYYMLHWICYYKLKTSGLWNTTEYQWGNICCYITIHGVIMSTKAGNLRGFSCIQLFSYLQLLIVVREARGATTARWFASGWTCRQMEKVFFSRRFKMEKACFLGCFFVVWFLGIFLKICCFLRANKFAC